MGIAYFNSNGSSSGGDRLLYRMKPVPIPTQLYGTGSTNANRMPVIRAGAGDKSFAGGLTLYTTSPLGNSTITATVSYTTYLTGSFAYGSFLSSGDQCLYVLLGQGSNRRLIKVNDTTGVVTTIGLSFVPTNPSNWENGSSVELDTTSGHIKISYNGFYHLLHKTTGAIVSQDTPIIIGSFLARNVFYVTQDQTVGVSVDVANPNEDSLLYFPNMVHSTYGHSQMFSVPVAQQLIFDGGLQVSPLHKGNITLVDSDKVFLGGYGGNSYGMKLYLRTDFDKYIKSIAEVAAGVI